MEPYSTRHVRLTHRMRNLQNKIDSFKLGRDENGVPLDMDMIDYECMNDEYIIADTEDAQLLETIRNHKFRKMSRIRHHALVVDQQWAKYGKRYGK